MTFKTSSRGSPQSGPRVLLRALLAAAASFTTIVVAGPALPGDAPSVKADPAVLYTPDDMGTGSLLLKTTEPGKYLEAPRLKTDVRVDVSGLIARATITQRFENPSDKWVEGMYVYPLSQNAAVDALKMQVGDKFLEGQIKERAEARQIYEKAAAAGVKASLVEQQRPNMFTNSVANIGPHETVIVQIEYQEAVRLDHGKFELRVPLVVGPRYIPGQDPLLMVSSEATPRTSVPDANKISPPVLHPKFGKINPVSLSVHLKSGVALDAVQSLYHYTNIERSDATTADVSLTGAVPADRDFVLDWSLKPQATPQASLFRETIGDKSYYFAMVLPPVGTKAPQRQPREAIFVIDNSGSMAGESMNQAKAALLKALAKLQPEDTFNVIRFDDTFDVLFKDAVPANRTNVLVAERFVGGLQANGGTEIYAALQAALKDKRVNDASRLRQVIFLTDGAVGNEDQVLAEIGKSLGRSRLFTIGIGSAPNTFLMEHIATQGRGSFTHIGSENEVEQKVGDLFNKLEAPVMTDLKVGTQGVNLETWPNPVPDLYAGEPVVLTTMTTARAGNVSITGRLGAKPWSASLDLASATEGHGVSKIWARSKITAIDSSRYTGAKQGDVDAQVLTVALEHHLVSRLTSLVAIDVTPSRPKDENLESQEMPTNLPHGWNFEKVFGEDPNSPSIETSIDPVALTKLAMADKPVVMASADGVELPQTDAGSDLLLVIGFLMLASGAIVIAIAGLKVARK
ncbi:MAG: marine proteobacterial sortase target protein [Micropepsaceae bacterium]